MKPAHFWNPAQLSAIVAQLFDRGAVATELRTFADSALLFPLEAAHCRGFARKRLAEFTGGRLCARRALSELGIEHAPIVVNADRSPRWPPGTVGSITHTSGLCSAVVAPQDKFGSVGVDVETNGRVTGEIESLVMTAPELLFLSGLDEAQRQLATTIIFSAKEAFYKCQYPVSRGWLDFRDVWLELTTDDMRSGWFTVRPYSDAPAFHNGPDLPRRGRFVVDGSFTYTGISLFPQSS